MADIKNLDVDGQFFDCVIDWGSNSNGWYRIWRSGLIEQGGNQIDSNTYKVVYLPIPYSNINYSVVHSEFMQNPTAENTDTEGADHNIGATDKKVNSFRISKASNRGISFYTRGY